MVDACSCSCPPATPPRKHTLNTPMMAGWLSLPRKQSLHVAHRGRMKKWCASSHRRSEAPLNGTSTKKSSTTAERRPELLQTRSFSPRLPSSICMTFRSHARMLGCARRSGPRAFFYCASTSTLFHGWPRPGKPPATPRSLAVVLAQDMQAACVGRGVVASYWHTSCPFPSVHRTHTDTGRTRGCDGHMGQARPPPSQTRGTPHIPCLR